MNEPEKIEVQIVAEPYRTRAFWWKLALFKGSNGWYISAGTAFLGFTDAPSWRTPTMEIVRLALFCTIAGNKFLDGFLDQAVSRLQSGKPPIGHGDTERFGKGAAKAAIGLLLIGSLILHYLVGL